MDPRDEQVRLIGERKRMLCTNLLFLCFLMIMMCAVVIVSALSYGEGNPLRILKPTECSYGFTCGTRAGAAIENPPVPYQQIEKLSYLFYHKPYDLPNSKSFCVQSCTKEPITKFKDMITPTGGCYCGYRCSALNQENPLLANQVNVAGVVSSSSSSSAVAISSGGSIDRFRNNSGWFAVLNNPLDPICAMIPVPQTTAIFSRCVTLAANRWLHFAPLDGENMAALKNEALATAKTIHHLNDERLRTTYQQNAHDLYFYGRDLLWASFLASIFGVLFLTILHFASKLMFYVTASLFAIGGAAICSLLWYLFTAYRAIFNRKRAEQSQWLDAATAKQIGLRTGQLLLLDSQLANQPAYLWLAIIATVFFASLLVALICMFRRTLMCSALYYEIGNILHHRKKLFLAPICTLICIMLVSFHFYYTLAFNITSDRFRETTPNDNTSDAILRHCYTFRNTRLQQGWISLLVFALWLGELLLVSQRIVVAQAVCTFYFSRLKVAVPYHAGETVLRIFKHHIGTVALAALCLPLFRIPRIFFSFFRKRLYVAALASSKKRTRNKEEKLSTIEFDEIDMSRGHNACISCCETTCSPCLMCENSLLRYIDSSLLVFVATRGYDVLDAAYSSHSLFQRSAFRVRALANVAKTQLFIAKCSVTFIVTSISLFIHQFGAGRPGLDLSFYVPNVVYVAVISFYVADCFFSFYEAAVDALACCVCEDVEVNDGTLSREYLMPVSLMELIRRSSIKLSSFTRRSKADYAASIIINHNLDHNAKYKKDKRLIDNTKL